jgi:hypothetical protein
VQPRHDIGGDLGEPIIREDGTRVYDAAIFRSGVFEYPDGREYTPPEVLAEAARHAIALPLVVPRLADGEPIVHPENYQDPERREADRVGVSGTEATFDGKHLRTKLIVDSKRGAEAAAAGLHELSPGYDVATLDQPGVTPDGERYDRIRTKVRLNHLLMLPKGAGRQGPEVRFRADSCGRYVAPTHTGVPTMAQVEIGGVTYEMDAEAAKAVASIKGDLTSQTQRADAAEAKAAESSGALAIERSRADAAEATLKQRHDAADAEFAARLAEHEEIKPIAERLGVPTKTDDGAIRPQDSVRRDCVAASLGDTAWRDSQRHDAAEVKGAFAMLRKNLERGDVGLQAAFAGATKPAAAINDVDAARARRNALRAGKEV